MLSLPLKSWSTRFQQWVAYSLIALIITTALAVFGIITYTNDGAKVNSRRIFESTLWNALQLQLQSYRFLNYLIKLKESDFPLKGNAFFEYDLLMSRVDLLREGTVGSLIRGFSGGRAVRSLNIINGELELISLNITKIESGDASYLADLVDRIEKLDKQINEFVILVNQGSNQYIAQQHQTLQSNLDRIQILTILFLTSLLFLCFFIIKSLAKARGISLKNRNLEAQILTVHQDKSNMISFINQEIKAPINAILSISKTLQKQVESEASHELSNNIEESGQQLLSTVAMFTDLAQLDAQELTFMSSIGNLRNTIEGYILTLESQLTRKDLQAITYIEPALPEEINIDFSRLQIIIAALLQNAIAHTPGGSISLQIRPSALMPSSQNYSEDNQRVIQIAIRDTGIGMDSQLQQNLRLNPKTQNAPLQNKVGLALTLCHKLVDLMKGEIHFSCAPQKGCEFWVDIPFHVPISTQVKRETFSCTTTKQALLIESDAHLARIFCLQLDALNINTTVSEDGIFQEEIHYDLVILGGTSLVDNETYSVLQQWHDNGLPFVCYNTKNQASNKHMLYDALILTPPFTQSRLEQAIYRLFGGNQDHIQTHDNK